MWETVREELGIRRVPDEEAAGFLLKYWARETVDGKIDVLQGSRLMQRVAWFPLGYPKELNELVSLLDDWDEIPLRREAIASKLLAFAQELLRSTQ